LICCIFVGPTASVSKLEGLLEAGTRHCETIELANAFTKY